MSTLFGFTASVAVPPLRDIVPITVSVIFFFTFFWTSKVTVPVGTPEPGKVDRTSAFSPSDTSLCFLANTGCGARWTRAPAFDTVAGKAPDVPGRRSESPL